MARFVPKNLSDKVRQHPRKQAEVAVYDALKSQLPKDSGFCVYYSMNWFNQNTDIRRDDGECDFIICNAAHGIVFIEVKGGQVSRKAEQWLSRDRNNVIHEITNPITQARDSKNVLLSHLRSRWESQNTERFPWVECRHAVLLPDSMKKTQELGIEAVIDMFGFKEDMENIHKRILKFLTMDKGNSPRSKNHLRDQAKIIKILHEILAPDLDFTFSYSDYISDIESDIEKASGKILDHYETYKLNKKIKVSGPAGSGKTYLGLQAAIQKAEEGENVLFICFNKALSVWLTHKTKDQKNIKVRTFHSLIYELMMLAEFRSGEINEDVEILIAHPENIPADYDLIVVDELQDFDEKWFDIICVLGTGNSSKTLLLSDYNQKLWNKPRIVTEGFFEINLQEILRNTCYISQSSKAYYQGHEFKCVGPLGSEITIEANAQDIDDVAKSINYFQINKINPEDIAVLTDFPADGVTPELEQKTGLKFQNAENLGKSIIIDTIGRFKGLESKVVILWLRKPETGFENLYVGFTRAKTDLTIVCSSITKENITKDIAVHIAEGMDRYS